MSGKPRLSKAKLMEWRMHRAERFLAHLKERVERLERAATPDAPAAGISPGADATLFDYLTAPAPVAGHNQGDD